MEEEFTKEIQGLVDEAELVEDLKPALREAQDAMIKEAIEDAQKIPWYIKIRNLFCRVVKRVVQIVCTEVKSTVLFIINNENNQSLAKLAVLAAIKAGLKGNPAWTAAWAVLQAGEIWISATKKVKAREVDTNIKETLLQLVYTCVKNKEVTK